MERLIRGTGKGEKVKISQGHVAPEVNALWNQTLSSCRWETLGCKAAACDAQWCTGLIWIQCHRGTLPAWSPLFFSFSFSLFSPEFTAESPKICPQILELSRRNQKWPHCWSWGTSHGAGTEPCARPLLSSYGSLAPCYGVAWAQKSLSKWATNLQFKPCLCIWREENKPKLFVCAVVQLLEDHSSW